MIAVNPPELLARYASERKSLVLAMIIHVGMAMVMGGLVSHSQERWLLLFPAGWAALWTLMPIYRLNALAQEKRLAEMHRATGFIISDAGVSCNIALLDGKARHTTRSKDRGTLQLAWDDIAQLRVLPERIIRSHEPQYRRMQHVTPGVYALTLSDGSQVRILRTLLKAHEPDIINFIRTHTKVPVEIQDQLG